jgi:hypothetical protein
MLGDSEAANSVDAGNQYEVTRGHHISFLSDGVRLDSNLTLREIGSSGSPKKESSRRVVHERDTSSKVAVPSGYVRED